MIYRNTKTGVVLDSPCEISGGDWVAEEEIDFESMTVAELKDFAEEHEIDLGDAKKKDDIVAVLSSTK